MANKYNYVEMSVLNVKSIKVTNSENVDNLTHHVSPKGIWGGARYTFWELEGRT